MTLLSDRSIKEAVAMDVIGLDPWFPETQLQPASYDVTLGPTIAHPTNGRKVDIRDSETGYGVIPPGSFLLGATQERLTLPRTIAARFEGKSSLGRIGLMTHVTAGFIDPGFDGTITVELHNVSKEPINLTPGMRIGQLCFMLLDRACERPYGSEGLGSHYQGQTEPTLSWLA